MVRLRKLSVIIGYSALGIAILLIPLFTSGFFLKFFTVTWIMAISVLGLYLISTAGEINFAHSAFMAIGAYTSALLTLHLGLPFWQAFIIGALISGAVGLGLGYLTLRLKGAYFFLVSFGFSQVVLLIISQLKELTGGYCGLTMPSPGDFFRSSDLPFYYLVVFILMATFVMMQIIDRSRVGMTMRGISQADGLATSVGINIMQYKAYILTLSCCIAGISGVLLAYYLRFATPELFSLHQMINILTYLIVGGMGSPGGSIIGTFVIRGLVQLFGGLREYETVFSSIMLIVIIIFWRGGLISLIRWPSALRRKAEIGKE